MKILILGGFLGSGKTSLLIDLAKYVIGEGATMGDAKVVILENEIGEVGVDDVMLQSTGLTVENMFAGCVCCSMSGQLIPTLRELDRDYHPELVILETTGVACPKQVRDTLLEVLDGMDVRICTTVDAKRWPRLKRAMAQLVDSQLQDANTVLINKIDLVEPQDVQQVIDDLKQVNDKPEFLAVSAVQGVDPTVWQKVLGEDELR